MRESTAGESSRRETKDNKHEAEHRKSDATSKETLSDLEQDKTISDTKPVNQRSIPAPDGTPDPDQGSRSADDSDAGGPM